MEEQEAWVEIDRVLGCNPGASYQDVLDSTSLLDRVRESLKRKGLLLGEATQTTSAAAAAAATTAVPVDFADDRNNPQCVREEDGRVFKDRAATWILARKRNKQLRCPLDFSSFDPVEMIASTTIQDFFVEGARSRALLDHAEDPCCTAAKSRTLDKSGCSTEITAKSAPVRDQSNPVAITNGSMAPLTPDLVRQTCRGMSPGSSADRDSRRNDRGAACRTPAMANGGLTAMAAEETSTLNVSPSQDAHPRAQKNVATQEVQVNASVIDKPTRKRKYQSKVKNENPKPTRRANRAGAVGISDTMCSPSLVQTKSFARINQQRPKLRRLQRGTAASTATSTESSAKSCSEPARPTAGPANQDAVTESTDFLRFLHDSLFAGHATKCLPADDRPDSRCNGNASLFTSSFHRDKEDEEEEEKKEEKQSEVDVDRCMEAKDSPSTPRAVPVPFLSSCWNFSLVGSLLSPTSLHGTSDGADPWNDNFDENINSNSRDHVSTTPARRALKFDVPHLKEDQEDLRKHSPQVTAPEAAALDYTGLPQIPEKVEVSVPQVVAVDPGAPEREQGMLQMVAYDESSKRIVVYPRRWPRIRRLRYKPKVNLDASTVKMFKRLTIKAAGGDDEEEAEDERASWKRAQQLWHLRAHRFISCMRQVQGNRSFSRWKGSVLDSVGGAFLTQNVSDYLSSNAFMSLRARFPARTRDANATETPHKAEPPAQKHSSMSTEACVRRPESPTSQKGDHQRKENSSPRALLHSNTDCVSSCGEQSLSDLNTGLHWQCRVEAKLSGEGSTSRQGAEEAPEICRTTGHGRTEPTVPRQRLVFEDVCGEKEANPALSEATPAGFEAIMAIHDRYHPDPQTVDVLSSADENPSIFILTNKNSTLQEAILLQPKHDGGGDLDPERHAQKKLTTTTTTWKEKLAASGEIQRKFVSVVAESVSSSSLSAEGKEKVLAATLRLVLGKKQRHELLGPRLGLFQQQQQHKRKMARRSLRLRPARAAMRSSTNNSRYRRSVSFKLLVGEARASWEAGFVMKSQKAKWEPLRAAIVADERYQRAPWTADCVDWAAVRQASVHEVAEVIKNRGMNNALAGRMKAFLDRVHRDQNGNLDLEWIRWLPPDEAKAFLLSFRGVGIKSVECIRLLTLHHPSFPVDTNVGRILVRLGWVPLEPLPEETQLHLLELYPIQSQIQQYAWPRLCTLDQKTLYELHYQMITFGKVFCTKSKPNCNACPMRTECKHYASSYASAKLLLKGREEQERQATTVPLALLQQETPEPTSTGTESMQRAQGPLSTTKQLPCVPIIEEPHSPEPWNDGGDSSVPDIEELLPPRDFRAGPGIAVEIVSSTGFVSFAETGSSVAEECDLNLEVKKKVLLFDLNREPEAENRTGGGIPAAPVELAETTSVGRRNSMATSTPMNETHCKAVFEGNVEVLPDELPDDYNHHLPSQELILLPPQVSRAPAPKLKNIQRLRTVHFVYELPDNHPLLFQMDDREADDPCFYLLAIWSPDEVPATVPKINDYEFRNPFASWEGGCRNVDPGQTTVRGTLLIPCKTAMRGWFPLNGTYFQVNEVFADHASSLQPIDVPRTLLWTLRRRFVYFSTAVSNLFKDMSQEEIQCCFQKGYVCLRAFDVATRQPRILAPRLHQSGAKIVNAPAGRKGRGAGRRSTLLQAAAAAAAAANQKPTIGTEECEVS